MSFSTLMVKRAGQRDEVAVRVGRNNDRREVDGDQRLVVVVGEQPVVELVQQRERVRARRRVGDLQREHLAVARIRTPAVDRCQQTPSAGCR